MIDRCGKRFTLLAGLLGILFAGNACAFTLGTHVWVGQQVINDLADDGKITIVLRGKPVTLEVPAHVRSAILANQTEFLLGNIGPDSAPDILVGQTIVHPGIEDGWKTNDWLRFLLNSARGNAAGTAYAYGYLGHASADMFAHTYVNQYAGDIFDLADETLVEQRHIALEGFIGRLTPPLRDHTGKPLGAVRALIKPSDAFGTFVRDTLVLNDTVQEQYSRGKYGRHLAAYHGYRKSIDAMVANPAWNQLDVAVVRLFASNWGVALSSNDAQKIIDKANVIIPKVQAGEDRIQSLANDLVNATQHLDDALFSGVKTATQTVFSVEQEILQLHLQISSKESELRRKASCPKKWLDPVGYRACQKANDVIDSINGSVNAALGSLNGKLAAKRQQLLQASIAVRDAAVASQKLVQIVSNAAIDFSQRMGQNTSPIKGPLMGWRNDVDVAMREYVKATSQSLLNSTDPAASATEPLSRWFDCYHMSILGVAQELSGCELRDGARNVVWAVDRALKLAEDLAFAGDLLGLPTPSEIRAWRDEQIASAKDRLMAEIFDRLLPRELQDILALFSKDMDDAALNDYFSRPERHNDKNLLMIPDLAARVRAEMRVTDGAFDPQQYAVAYNAVVLAKLSLLDTAGLVALGQLAGAAPEAGRSVFAQTDNVIADAIASIDGNHQWMAVPPPRPNAVGAPYAQPASYAAPAGFVPWRPAVRSALFRGLFKGPLSSGVDVASELGFPTLLPSDYPYRPCAGYPFPDSAADQACQGIKIVPVLELLLD